MDHVKKLLVFKVGHDPHLSSLRRQATMKKASLTLNLILRERANAVLKGTIFHQFISSIEHELNLLDTCKN